MNSLIHMAILCTVCNQYTICISCTVQPEEILNEEAYRIRSKKEYAKLCVSIKEKFRILLPEGSTSFEEFREFASTYACDTHHMLAILKATTTDAIFCQLSVGKYITENNTTLLHCFMREYGDETVTTDKQRLEQFDMQKEFVEFSLRVVRKVADRSSAVELKVCILSTAVRFGRYYKMLEREQEVSVMIKLLRDWEHPELLHRVVRHFYPEGRQWLDKFIAQRESGSLQSTSAGRVHLSHLETYADLLQEIQLFLKANPQEAADVLNYVSSISLSTVYPSLRLVPTNCNTVSDALLALIPFTSYHNTYLMRRIVNNFCNDTLRRALLDRLKMWEIFADHTFISTIYDEQLDGLPLELTERKIVTLILHTKGERWKNPMFRHCLDLAFVTTTEFGLQPWSIIYCRAVLTGTEPGRKGDCKVETLVPALAACIVLRDGDQKEIFWQENSITYLELVVDDDCYLSGEPRSIGHIFQRAQAQQFFSPYFEELNNTAS